MHMTDSEIARSYKEAKSKRKQIEILAELNACSREGIEEVLITLGALKKRRTKEEPVPEKPENTPAPGKGKNSKPEKASKIQGSKISRKPQKRINTPAGGQSTKDENVKKPENTGLEEGIKIENVINPLDGELLITDEVNNLLLEELDNIEESINRLRAEYCKLEQDMARRRAEYDSYVQFLKRIKVRR